jgi:hypothetical protein
LLRVIVALHRSIMALLRVIDALYWSVVALLPDIVALQRSIGTLHRYIGALYRHISPLFGVISPTYAGAFRLDFLAMANFQVKNLPEPLHTRLRRYARRHHRTLSDVALAALEREMNRCESCDEP